MGDSFHGLTYFPVWPLPETAMGELWNCLLGAPPYARDTMIPLVRSQGSPLSTNDPTRPQAVTDRQKNKNKKNDTRVVDGSSSSERHVFTAALPTDANPIYI